MVLIRTRMEGGNLPDPDAVIPRQLEAAVTEATLLIEREAKIRTPIGVTEVARGSIGHRIRRGASLGRGVAIRGEIGSPAAHVDVLERGRRPGAKQPPSEALELWVRRKLGIRDVKEAKSVAFLIARSIGQKGTEGVEMFKKAVEENESTIRRIFERAGVRIEIQMAEED